MTRIAARWMLPIVLVAVTGCTRAAPYRTRTLLGPLRSASSMSQGPSPPRATRRGMSTPRTMIFSL
jgi:hypothetical protein